MNTTPAPTAAPTIALALFDLDHTLLDGDSNALWLDFLVERGLVDAHLRRQQADFVTHYVAEKLDINAYLRFHIGLMSGRPLSDWGPLLGEFIEEIIRPRISAAALACVAAHRAAGHRMAIISATHAVLTNAIGALFDLPVIASRVAVRAGYVTGEVDGPLCFRESKLSMLAASLEELGVDGSQGLEALAGESYFYSDSANDLPLLEAVRHPTAVNPDQRLSVVAAQRGWPVDLWRCD